MRHDNRYTHSDEALRIAPAFPRLKRLFLHNGQATNESMHGLADLEELEMFYVWAATELTDASVTHLKKLKSIHLGNGNIGDDTLKALAGLPNLSSISLQGNHFTDAGLVHVADAHQLHNAWVGLSKGAITDTGLAHLAGLENLEELEVQQSQITAEGLNDFRKKLPSVRIVK